MMAAPNGAVLPRLLAGAETGRALDLSEHTARHGRVPRRGPELIESVSRAGLRGRGGAAFPTATKLEAVAHARRTPVVVANGAEGEPASAKDRLLLESLPHLVLDGAVLAAEAVGAKECIVCVEESAHAAAASVRAALTERASARHDPVAVRLALTPDHYLAGEESALVHFLNGGALKPTFVPPRPFERGVDRRPTLVNNVETLGHIALIARHGSHWFRELGTASEPGSTLVTLSGAVRHPGVYEIARGTALADLVRAAGGATDELAALLVGGYFGTWVGGSELGDLRLEDAELAAHGAALGSGVVVAFGAAACGPAEVARVARFLASQSARQCGPCEFGLPAIAGALERAVAGRAGPDVWDDLGRWLRQVRGRGACHHPNGAVRFVASALATFSREWEDHVAHGPCEACAHAALLPVATSDLSATAA
jgi:NADH:ubiquinone oxidoreductase subunit F (NADH-binding)